MAVRSELDEAASVPDHGIALCAALHRARSDGTVPRAADQPPRAAPEVPDYPAIRSYIARVNDPVLARAVAVATGRTVGAEPGGGFSAAGGVSSIGRAVGECDLICTSGCRSSSAGETCEMLLFWRASIRPRTESAPPCRPRPSCGSSELPFAQFASSLSLKRLIKKQEVGRSPFPRTFRPRLVSRRMHNTSRLRSPLTTKVIVS